MKGKRTEQNVSHTVRVQFSFHLCHRSLMYHVFIVGKYEATAFDYSPQEYLLVGSGHSRLILEHI